MPVSTPRQDNGLIAQLRTRRMAIERSAVRFSWPHHAFLRNRLFRRSAEKARVFALLYGVCWLIFDDAPQRVDGAPPAQPAPTAVLDGTGQTFEDVEVARMAANDSAIATERSHECCVRRRAFRAPAAQR